jgi:hypothetical protein
MIVELRNASVFFMGQFPVILPHGNVFPGLFPVVQQNRKYYRRLLVVPYLCVVEQRYIPEQLKMNRNIRHAAFVENI